MKPTAPRGSLFMVVALTASLALVAGANSSSNAAPISVSSAARHPSNTQVPLRPNDEVIYDNGSPTETSDAFEITGYIEADDFTLSAAATWTGLFFWDLESPGGLGYQGEIDWILYYDAGGKPGAIFATGAAKGEQVTRTFLQGNVAGHYDQYSNSMIISPGVTLSAGTTYWLALHNGPFTFTTWADFYWQTSFDNETFNSHWNGAPFFDDDWGEYFGEQQGFYLTGTTAPLFVERVSSEKNGWEISLAGNGSGIEDRSGGPNNTYNLRFRFNGTLASVGGATASCGSVVSVEVDPNDASQALVGLTGVDCNASVVTVTVADVIDTDGNTLDAATATFGLLIGDVNGDGTVDRHDYDIVAAREGQATNANNFRADVSAKPAGIGHIDVSDAKLVRHQDGTQL